MQPKFDFGVEVRVIRSLRDDGTFPGRSRGEMLVSQGSVGYVKDVGTFLQDQVVYSVDFVEAGCLVGCREQELQLASDPWIHTQFEFRQRVTPLRRLGIGNEVIAEPGMEGEVERVLRHSPDGPTYHVRFSGRTLEVREAILTAMDDVRGEQHEG